MIKWSNLKSIIETANQKFIPVVLKCDFKEYSDEEIQFANLVMFIRNKERLKNSSYIDLAMMYYVLHSEDPFEEKMKHISEQKNFTMILQQNNQFNKAKIGFC